MSPQQTSHATATRLLRAFLAEAYSPDQFYTDCATLGPEDQLQPPGGSKSAAVEEVLPRLG